MPLPSRLTVALLIAASAFPAVPAAGAAGGRPAEIIVRYRPGVSKQVRAAVRGRLDARLAHPVKGLARTEVLTAGGDASTEELLEDLNARPEVLYAEPNHRYKAFLTPNDPLFSSTWGLHNTGQSGGVADADIDAPEAWDVTTGDPGVTVAVVDTGVDLDHPDLLGNLVPGWDFVGGDASPDDGHGHGTHVSGTIGAVGDNGTGVAGVAWDASIMPLKALDDSGFGDADDVAAAFVYAGEQGARVVNASLGGPFSQTIADAVAASPGTLFVVAAGNSGSNNDVSPAYPCNLTASNLICVAATTRTDALASFSSYGKTSVDVGAPGKSIVSTVPPEVVGASYASSDGTSMATPHVVGAAVLIWSAIPGATVEGVKKVLLQSADPLSALSGKTVSGGRLNVAAALDLATRAPDPPTPSVSRVQKARTFPVGWSSWSIQGIPGYDTRYRGSTLGQDLPSEPSDWLNGTSQSGASFPGKAGRTYCFSARISPDGEWGQERCTIVPADDRVLARAGTWSTRTASRFYLGSASKSRRRGSTLTLSGIRAKDLSLVASRCRRCGTVKVRWNGTTLRKIKLTASSTKRTRIISVASFGAPRTGTLTIKVVSRDRTVLIEGMAVGAG
jgi:subtilisin family serine protease